MNESQQFQAPITGEGRYRLLVDAITDYAIYMLNPEGLVASWNSGARRFKGYEEAEILGSHFSRFYTEEDRARNLPQLALETAASQGRFEQEGWRIRKGGSRFWASVVIDPIYDQGKLVGFAKITRDLTERRMTQERLRSSEQQFQLLVNSVSDYAIYMLDPSGRVNSWNAGAQRIKGYQREEIIGEHFSRFYTEEARAAGEPEHALKAALQQGCVKTESWRVRKDGSRFWAQVSVEPVYDEAGDVLGFAKITRDVTDQMQARQALEKAREELFQVQKMETIGQLTGGIAHDFNNLLTVVIGSLELLQRRLPPDFKWTMLVENALKGAERGASLTQRMLAFARRQQLKPEPTDLLALVHGMADFLQRSVGPAVVVETRFPLSLPLVFVDGHQVELALLNLVTNSRDAMAGAGSVVIAAQQAEVTSGDSRKLEPGRYICLSVTDTGEGMDEETLARAMEPFFTTKGVGKGTGLGLSMVHGLMEQLGGALVLTSQAGEGTTAELWLPEAPMSSIDSSSHFLAEPDTEEAKQSSLSILLVDDDALVLSSTSALLDDTGYRVTVAPSGAEALRIIESGAALDAVLTDYAMPQMTGADLAERVFKIRPELAVILTSGFADQLGISVDLPRLDKPWRQDELYRTIINAITSRRSGSGTP